jgi:subtilisin family serine protease
MARPARTKQATRTRKTTPTEEVRVAVTFRRASDQLGLTHYGAAVTADVVESFRPDPRLRASVIDALGKHGFYVTARGEVSLSMRGRRVDFEETFGTRLATRRVARGDERRAQSIRFFAPPDKAAWNPDQSLMALIDDAYIQWPHLYMANRFPEGSPSPIPPRVGYHHLRVPGDVAMVVNAARVHRQGTTGRGVTVVMVDSGFGFPRQPYFGEMGYRTSVVLAAGATDVEEDLSGHGTGESANLLAIAPDINFVGVKLDNGDDPSAGASLLEGIQEAKTHNPDVISVSIGFDLVLSGPERKHRANLPNSLKALEAEIQALVASGVVVVFSAGNGHVAFPGMMPEVISAGGVFVDEIGRMEASDYASAFKSRVYPGRRVPDLSGLVGMQPGARYIALPVPSKSELDGLSDDTANKDGWGVFSGTSAAAPQLAGVAALLLEKNPALTPGEVKAVLRRTCLDVVRGSSNPVSNQGRALRARSGLDSATGAGLVDAFAAWQQV